MRVLGIDTSCYTTSVALVEDGRIAQERRLLSVAQGERGLRQSSALFQHVERLPELLEALFAHSPGCVDGVCVSTRPRDAEGSYMPVFKAGECAARAIAAAQGVPLVETSHQQGHIRAALVDSGCGEAEFVALHLSGGTTEAVFVGQGLKTRLIAMSADLHAGQLVDRVGVALGLSFPAGPALEALARQGSAGDAHDRRGRSWGGCGGGSVFLSFSRGGETHRNCRAGNGGKTGIVGRRRGFQRAFARTVARAPQAKWFESGALLGQAGIFRRQRRGRGFDRIR